MARKPEDTAQRYIGEEDALGELRDRAQGCTACDLHADATQTVFGEGPSTAVVMFVGEQPGDAEDQDGHPFVGPAGRLLDKALADAGIDRRKTYVTNVVKHFKHIVRGKKRLHRKPNVLEIEACRPWLDAEIDRVGPEIIICLGATAAKALYGNDFRVSRQRGAPVPSPLAPRAFATVHPSSLLRLPDSESRASAYEEFVRDLRAAVEGVSAARAPKS